MESLARIPQAFVIQFPYKMQLLWSDNEEGYPAPEDWASLKNTRNWDSLLSKSSELIISCQSKMKLLVVRKTCMIGARLFAKTYASFLPPLWSLSKRFRFLFTRMICDFIWISYLPWLSLPEIVTHVDLALQITAQKMRRSQPFMTLLA